MSRGMTPAILAMVNERERDKLRCMLNLRQPPKAVMPPSGQAQIQRIEKLS